LYRVAPVFGQSQFFTNIESFRVMGK
jgi:hypothetical protein